MKISAFRRPDGQLGVRNHVVVIPTVLCANESARMIAEQVDGLAAGVDALDVGSRKHLDGVAGGGRRRAFLDRLEREIETPVAGRVAPRRRDVVRLLGEGGGGGEGEAEAEEEQEEADRATRSKHRVAPRARRAESTTHRPLPWTECVPTIPGTPCLYGRTP